MDQADQRAPYRCLPMVMANQYGWEILSTHHVRATWDGTNRIGGLHVENLTEFNSQVCRSHFGEGVLTFHIPYLFQTPSGWNLFVRGPTNSAKDGIAALDGIVENDWNHATFTMNWRFTRPCTIEFSVGEPICLFFPVQRGALEQFQPKLRLLRDNPELHEKFRNWSNSRGEFLQDLSNQVPAVVSRAWQRDYVHAAKQKRPIACPFTK